MKHVFGLAAFGVGIALLILGFNAPGPDGPGLTALASTNPWWLLAGGGLAVLSGLTLTFQSTRRRDF